MSTPINLTPEQLATGRQAVESLTAELRAEDSLGALKELRVVMFTTLLQAVGWVRKDGTLSVRGRQAIDDKRGTALAVAIVDPTWEAWTATGPGELVTFAHVSNGSKTHEAVMSAAKDADILLADKVACAKADMSDLVSAHHAREYRVYLLRVGRVQTAVSEALRTAAKASGIVSEPKRRGARPADGSATTGTPAASGQDATVTASLTQIAASVTPEAANAAKAAGKALAPAAPVVIDHVGAILAMNVDSAAHALLGRLLIGLTNRPGSSPAVLRACEEYLQAHAAPMTDADLLADSDVTA